MTPLEKARQALNRQNQAYLELMQSQCFKEFLAVAEASREILEKWRKGLNADKEVNRLNTEIVVLEYALREVFREK